MTLPLCLTVLAAGASLLAQPLVVITPPTRTDSGGHVTAVLQNISSQAITAYAVRWTFAGTPHGENSQDFFAALGLEPLIKAAAAKGLPTGNVGLNALPPAGTITVHDGHQPDEKASVEVVAVVFADCTAVGDEAEIRSIFADRKAEAGILQRFLDGASKLDRSNPHEFFAALAKLPHPPGRDPTEWMQQEAEMQLKPDLPEQLKLTPDFFMEVLRSRTSAAVAHSTRRVL